jgi:hypothetical protein
VLVSDIAHRGVDVGGPPPWAFVLVGGLVLGIIALYASSLLLGPAVLVVAVVPMIVLTLALGPLFRYWNSRHAVALAEAAGAVEPIQVWGRVTEAGGECPEGGTPRKGAEFALSQDDVWPHLCRHAREAVVETAAKMERGECIPDCPIWYHDADHSFRIELHRERNPVHVELRGAA